MSGCQRSDSSLLQQIIHAYTSQFTEIWYSALFNAQCTMCITAQYKVHPKVHHKCNGYFQRRNSSLPTNACAIHCAMLEHSGILKKIFQNTAKQNKIESPLSKSIAFNIVSSWERLLPLGPTNTCTLHGAQNCSILVLIVVQCSAKEPPPLPPLVHTNLTTWHPPKPTQA